MHSAMKQIDICLDFSSNYHVAAGAGTGKTTILTRRAISFLLAADENRPERLLCMTFTRNAAAEMRKRIKGELEAVVRLISGELTREAAEKEYNFLPLLIDEMISRGFGDSGVLLKRAKEAAANLDLAVMSTLHSFCGEVIREFPMQAGVVPDFAIDEDGIAEKGMIDDSLHLFIFSLLNAEKVGKSDSLFFAEQFKIEGISEILRCAASRREISEFLERTAQEMKSEIFIGKSNKYMVESADTMETAKKIASLAADFASLSNAQFHESGMISYDDMLAKCRRLLRENRRVRHVYKSRFGAILVDELQDTDPAQFDIIYALGEAPGSFSRELRKVNFANGKVFLVGDPKQSIYRFRGADLEIYKEMLSVLRNSGAFREFELNVNHRSHKGILDVVNAVFSGEMKDDYSAIVPCPKKETPVAGGEVEFHIPSKCADGSVLNADLAREVMAVSLGRWIENNAGEGKRFNYGDITILTRSATENQIGHLVSVMKLLGIPYIFEGSRSFFLSQEIRDMVNFLKAVVSPEDRKSLIGFLRSPLCAFSDSAILLLASEGLLDYRKAAIRDAQKAGDRLLEDADHIYGKLRQAHFFSTILPIEEFVERVFALFMVSSVYSGHEWRQGESGNVEKFKKKLIALVRAGMTLRSAIDAVAEMMKKEEKEAEYPTVDETVDAVRIRTIHSAKGLEFPVVIIFDYGSRKKMEMPSLIADRKSGRCFLKLKSKEGRYFANDGYLEYYTNTFRKIDEAEEVRVNYVAMTRAKEKLLIFGNLWKKQRRGVSTNRDLERAIESLGVGTGEIRSALCETDGISYRINLLEHVWMRDLGHTRKGGVDFILTREKIPALVQALAARESEYVEYRDKKLITHPSAFIGNAEDSAGSERSDLQEPRRFAGATPQSAAIAIGTAAHRILERLDFNAHMESFAGVLETTVQELADQGVISERERFTMELESIFSKFFESADFQEIRNSEIIGREIPMIAPGENGTAVTGRIDIIYRRADGTVVVADYKTGDDSGARGTFEAQKEIYTRCVKSALNASDLIFKFIFL